MILKIFTVMIKNSKPERIFTAPRSRKNRRSRLYFYLPAVFFSILLALSLSRCADTKGILTDEILPPPPAMYLWITSSYYRGGSFGGVDGATEKCKGDTEAIDNLPSGFTYHHRAVIVDSNTEERDFPQNWPISGKDRKILRNLREDPSAAPPVPHDITTQIAANYNAVFNTYLNDSPLDAGITDRGNTYWTGLAWSSPPDAGFTLDDEHCTDWSISIDTGNGRPGRGNGIDQNSLSTSSEACATPFSILCLSY